MNSNQTEITQDLRNQVIQKLSTLFPNSNVSHTGEVVERMCYNKSDGNKESYIRLCSKLLMSCNRPKPLQTPVTSTGSSHMTYPTSSSNAGGSKSVADVDNVQQKKIVHPIRLTNPDSVGTTASIVTIPADPMNALQNLTATAGKNGGNTMNMVNQGTSSNQQPQIIVHSMNLPQAQQANINMKNILQVAPRRRIITRLAQPIYNNQIRQISPNIQQRNIVQPVTTYRQHQPQSTVITSTNQIQHITTAASMNPHQSNSIRILHPKIHIAQNSQSMQSAVQYDSSTIHQGHHQIYRPNNTQVSHATSQIISSNSNTMPMVTTTAGTPISIGNPMQQHHGHNINIHSMQTGTMYQPQPHSLHQMNPNVNTIPVTSSMQNFKAQPIITTNTNVPQKQPSASAPAPVQAQPSASSSSKSGQQIPPSDEEAREVADELNKLLHQYGHVLKLATQTSGSVFPDEAKKKVSIAIKSLLENHTTITKPIYRRNLPKIREICKSTESYWRQYKLKKDGSAAVSQKKVGTLSNTSKSSTCVISTPQHQKVNIPDPLFDSKTSSAPLSLDIAYDRVLFQLAQVDPKVLKNTRKRIKDYILNDSSDNKYKKLALNFEKVEEETMKEEKPFREEEINIFDSFSDEDSSAKELVEFETFNLKNDYDNNIFDERGLLKTNLQTSDFAFRVTRGINADIELVSKEFHIILPTLEERQKDCWKLGVIYKNTTLRLDTLILEITQLSSHEFCVSSWSWKHPFDPRSVISTITKLIEQKIQTIKKEMFQGPPLLYTLSLFKQAVSEVTPSYNSSQHVPINPDQSMIV